MRAIEQGLHGCCGFRRQTDAAAQADRPICPGVGRRRPQLSPAVGAEHGLGHGSLQNSAAASRRMHGQQTRARAQCGLGSQHRRTHLSVTSGDQQGVAVRALVVEFMPRAQAERIRGEVGKRTVGLHGEFRV